MKKEKGILGKLLASVGVLLVVVGVFVFQGITHAEDGVDSTDGEGAGVVVGGAEGEGTEGGDPEGANPESTDPEGADPEGADPEGTDPEEPGGTDEPVEPATLHAYIVD